MDQALANDQRAPGRGARRQAQLQIAQLNLSYTEISAPIDGRIGLTNYTVGNLVGPDSGVLATIVSDDPIYVTFPVSSRVILEVRQAAVAAGQPDAFVVHAQLPDGTTYAHPGKINFLDIEADQTTDTITVRAEFPNPESLLVDGEFVNVAVERDQARGAAGRAAAGAAARSGGLIRAAGQRPGPGRAATDPDRPGSTQGNVVVQSGLQPGERVIVEGIQKVRPGMKVQATVVPPPPSGRRPLAAGGERNPRAHRGLAAPADASRPADAGASRWRDVRLPRPVARAHRRRPTARPPRPWRQRASRSGR